MTATMRIAICAAPGRLELQTRPVPVPRDDQVLVRVTVCGICASDVGVWRGKVPKEYPYSPGHEFCGRVERVGAAVAGLQTGTSVVIDPNLGCGVCRYCREGRPNLCDSLKTRPIKSNGGFAEYVALDARMVHPVPAGLDDTVAALAEPCSCALHAARAADAAQPRCVAVFGAGVLGLLTTLALHRPNREIILIEPVENRRQRAHRLLGSQVLRPEEYERLSRTREIDAAVDCSGRMEAVALGLRTLRKTGRLVLAGLISDPTAAALPLLDVTAKELEIVGVWLNPDTFADALRLVGENRRLLQALESETFTLENIEAAFTRATSPVVHKVFVRP